MGLNIIYDVINTIIIVIGIGDILEIVWMLFTMVFDCIPKKPIIYARININEYIIDKL